MKYKKPIITGILVLAITFFSSTIKNNKSNILTTDEHDIDEEKISHTMFIEMPTETEIIAIPNQEVEKNRVIKIESSETVISQKEENIILDENICYVLVNDTPIYDSILDDKKEIGSISEFQKVLQINQVGEYAYVQTENLTFGYVPISHIEFLPDVFVEIDISDQIINLYKEEQILLTSLIVTGKDSTPTRIGYFPISYKTTDTYLKGIDYNCHVDYWMPFDNGIGLHDASWRENFGGDIYQSNGSHGCVNLPLETAATIYNTVDTGTMVLVHK